MNASPAARSGNEGIDVVGQSHVLQKVAVGHPIRGGPLLRRLDDFERGLLSYVALWAPYGGPPAEEILPRFGILSYELADRVREIAGRTLRPGMNSEDRDLVTGAYAFIQARTSAPRASERLRGSSGDAD